MSAVAESEELRALSFVRRCVLKKNEKIRELSKKCAKMEEQIQNLKWKCSDLEKENERLSSALTWDDAKHSNGTGGSSVVGIPGVEENLQFSDTAASTSVKKELAELDFSRVDPAFRTDELGTSETEHSTSGGTVPSGVGQRKRTLTADATDPDTLPGAPGNTARKKARSIASRTDPDTGDVTGSGDQLNQSAASTEDDYIDDSVQPLDHEDVSNHSNSNFTATQYLPNASSVVGELLPEGAAEMDPQQVDTQRTARTSQPHGFTHGVDAGRPSHIAAWSQAISSPSDQAMISEAVGVLDQGFPSIADKRILQANPTFEGEAILHEMSSPCGAEMPSRLVPARFVCSVCGLACLSRSKLETHSRTHTGEKPFKCPRCLYRCAQKGSLKRHLANVHGQDSTCEGP